MASFGDGLGAIIGSSLAAGDLENGQNMVNGNANSFFGTTAPNVTFGQSFLPQAQNAINNASTFASGTQSYDDFMKNYSTSPAAKYDIQQGTEATNNSAAATGSLLSGSNLRALDTMTQDISNKYSNQAYQNYLAGNNQQFGQLESLIGNMFSGIGVGTTATGQNASVVNGQSSANASLAAAQAKNSQSKGSGFGSLFGGIGSLFSAF